MRPPLVVLASARELPPGDAWLGAEERATLARLRAPRRRRDFRLGRLAARRAVALLDGRLAGAGTGTLEVRRGPGGAPWACREGVPVDATLSISHSDGWAAAAVQPGRVRLGCDVESVAPRSPGFSADYFTPAEQAFLGGGGPGEAALRATLLWSAKESVMKALGEGLRLAPRGVEVLPCLAPPTAAGWRAFSIAGPPQARNLRGSWRVAEGLVLSVAAEAGEPSLQS